VTESKQTTQRSTASHAIKSLEHNANNI